MPDSEIQWVWVEWSLAVKERGLREWVLVTSIQVSAALSQRMAAEEEPFEVFLWAYMKGIAP